MNIVITKLTSIPAGSNPFHHDLTSMGTEIASNFTIMHSNFHNERMKSMILVNTETGERYNFEFNHRGMEIECVICPTRNECNIEYGECAHNPDVCKGFWKCDNCGWAGTDLEICWAMNNGEKVDIIDYFCPKCPKDKTRWIGSPEQREAWWNKQWRK